MHYLDMRAKARTGDLILVEGSGLVGQLVRILTAQQFSHVAILLWLDEGLWVAEMRNHGYSLMPASQRLPQMQNEGQLYWGQAPIPVPLYQQEIALEALKYRGRRYSYWSLATVWISQIFRRPLPRALVCSTLVEKVWRVAGIEWSQTPDPGDCMRKCLAVHPLTKPTKEGTINHGL